MDDDLRAWHCYHLLLVPSDVHYPRLSSQQSRAVVHGVDEEVLVDSSGPCLQSPGAWFTIVGIFIKSDILQISQILLEDDAPYRIGYLSSTYQDLAVLLELTFHQ